VILLAAMTAAETAPNHHKGYPRSAGSCYGACYGACYGVGYEGWGGCSGGWGLPYSGYCGYGAHHHPHGIPPQPPWPGYACFGGCGGYMSPAFGYKMPTLDTATPPVSSEDKKNKDATKPKDTEKMRDKNSIDKDTPKIDEDKDGKEGMTQSSARARLIITLPAGAKLYVDDQPIPATNKKEFRTPKLEQGEKYFYDLRAEIVQDGKTVTKTKRVTITAGDVIKADFSTPGSQRGVAAAEE